MIERFRRCQVACRLAGRPARFRGGGTRRLRWGTRISRCGLAEEISWANDGQPSLVSNVTRRTLVTRLSRRGRSCGNCGARPRLSGPAAASCCEGPYIIHFQGIKRNLCRRGRRGARAGAAAAGGPMSGDTVSHGPSARGPRPPLDTGGERVRKLLRSTTGPRRGLRLHRATSTARTHESRSFPPARRCAKKICRPPIFFLQSRQNTL